VAALLELRAEVDCREPVSGWSPLMYAVTAGDRGTAEVLLAHGASVDAVAKPHDWNALYAALVSNREDMIGLLLDAGADHKSILARHKYFSAFFADALQQHVARREEAQQAAKQRRQRAPGAGSRAAGGPGAAAKAARPCMRPYDYYQYC